MAKLMEKVNLDGFEKVGLAQRISQTLIKAILDRTLKGGDQLVETQLQKLFGVSRSPLREALRDLEKRGLVEIRPRQGSFVKKITRTDIDEHYPVQAALEGLAARESHARQTPGLCRKLTEQLEAMGAAVDQGDAARFVDHHEHFHNLYIDTCGNTLLIQMIRDLRLRGTVFRYFFPHTPEYCRNSLQVHHEIGKAFCNPNADPNEVGSIVSRHIEKMLVLEGWEL